MTLAYNRTLTPLPADAAGRMIEGRSEGEVDDTYDAVKRALESGSLRLVEGDSTKTKTKTEKSSTKASKTSSSTKKSSSKPKADEPDEEN